MLPVYQNGIVYTDRDIIGHSVYFIFIDLI